MQGSKIAIFGAGIAGLSCAHELARRGYRVDVFESLPEAGGFFRSARLPEHQNMPSEYSWHGMGPWYHNTFDIMRQIPYDEAGSVYQRALSRPIDFGIFADRRPAEFYDRGWRSIPRMFAMRGWDLLRWAHLMFKTWSADQRSRQRYARQNAAERWAQLLSPQAQRAWRSCFGPWIGSDWTLVSLHTAGEFFRKQLMTRPCHHHCADSEGPAWSQGPGDGWLLLRGPSSEAWFHPWVNYLEDLGVRFHWEQTLYTLSPEAACLADGSRVEADHFVLAINPFVLREIVERSPTLQSEPTLSQSAPLTQHGHHSQVSFRLAFGRHIHFPRPRTAVVLADSEFNLTLFAQEQAWTSDACLGEGIESLWTGTACITTRRGRVHGLPLEQCTRQQFQDEILAQIYDCQALQEMVAQANGGQNLRDFPIKRLEIWHEWKFAPLQILPPKWVNTSQNQPFLPDQKTSFANIHLAGAHTRTQADVWSIEAAVESGRRAARLIEPEVRVLDQYVPGWLRSLRRLDNLCYRAGLPHWLDLSLSALLIGLGWLIWRNR